MRKKVSIVELHDNILLWTVIFHFIMEGKKKHVNLQKLILDSFTGNSFFSAFFTSYLFFVCFRHLGGGLCLFAFLVLLLCLF